jgi:DNA processing protein
VQYTSEEKSYIWLDSFPLEGNEKRRLIKKAGSGVALIRNFENFRSDLIDFKKESVYNNMAASLSDNGAYFKKVLGFLDEKKITAIPYPSPDYPSEWKELSDYPLVAYVMGDVSVLKKRKLCIVGSRRTPAAALKVGGEIAKELSSEFTIVTGLADGGDTAAIEGGLKGGGKVACMLAGGFSAIPQSNLPLLKLVVKQGALISPHPYATEVRGYSYEYRNKLLAYLSEGVLVLGAGEKSGALITAKYAKKKGVKLFALPYPPMAAAGVGCNTLIKQGAFLTETATDILEQFGITAIKKKAEVPLSPDEEKLYLALKTSVEAHVTELSKTTGIPTFKALALLSALEVKGLVVSVGGNRYEVCG